MSFFDLPRTFHGIDIKCLVIHALRYCADVMAEQKNVRKHWLWEYYSKIEKNKIKCNFCDKVYNGGLQKLLKVHLYRAHAISHDEDKEQSNLARRYFTEEKKYSLKCKLCDKLILKGYNVHYLELHLTNKHLSQIKKEIQEEIKRSWVSEHIELNLIWIKCKTCNKRISIFKIGFLVKHLLKHGIENKIYQENTEKDKITTNQSVTEENNNGKCYKY